MRTCYRPEMRERDVTCTVHRVVMREVVTPVKCVVLVPEWQDRQQTIVVSKLVPREVEQQVTCCRMVPSAVVDPCTGCTTTVCKPQLYVQKVKCTVMTCVPETRQVTVRVCCMKPVEKTTECRRLVCELHPQTVTRKQCYCVMVPYQVTIKVPVCTPCVSCCR